MTESMILFCFDCGFVKPLSGEQSDTLRATMALLAECGVTFILRCPCGNTLHDMVTDMPSLATVPARIVETDGNEGESG